MRYISFILCLCFSTGCTWVPQTVNTSVPQLLIQYPLPPLPESIRRPPEEISVALFVMKDGSVTKVRFIHGSGDASWDSLAGTSIKQWQFAPAQMDDKPVSAWFHLRAQILYTSPEYYSLAEIGHHEKTLMDSLYEELKKGQDFYELAARSSTAHSQQNNGILGKVNIYNYPVHIRRQLSHLKLNEFTKPLKYGELYIIFKRLEE